MVIMIHQTTQSFFCNAYSLSLNRIELDKLGMRMVGDGWIQIGSPGSVISRTTNLPRNGKQLMGSLNAIQLHGFYPAGATKKVLFPSRSAKRTSVDIIPVCICIDRCMYVDLQIYGHIGTQLKHWYDDNMYMIVHVPIHIDR